MATADIETIFRIYGQDIFLELMANPYLSGGFGDGLLLTARNDMDEAEPFARLYFNTATAKALVTVLQRAIAEAEAGR